MDTPCAGADYIEVIYRIETRLPLADAATRIAQGQTFSTWVAVGKQSAAIEKSFGARVVEVREERPSAKGAPHAGTVRLAFPWKNFGPRLPNLLSTIFGELYELRDFTSVKALDIIMPSTFTRQFRGPQFGIERTRELIRFEDKRPLIGAIFKPCLGLSNDELARLAFDAAVGGIDFIKDDEIVGDTYFSSVEDRVRKVMRALKKAEDTTGRKVLYAVSITDRVDQLKNLHDIVLAEKGNCVMVNASAVGLSAVRMLAERTRLPIHAHRVFTAPYARSERWGLSMKIFTRLARLAGADHIHCGAIGGKLFEPDEAVCGNISACLDDMDSIRKVLPVNSGGQWAGTVPASLEKIGHTNFLHLFGGGIFGHPAGARAGVLSIVQAYDACARKVPLEKYAKEYEELGQALKSFGKAHEH